MRNNETIDIKRQHVTTRSTHTVDCFRKIKDEETGKVSVKRWQEVRQVGATLVAALGGVFHNGARIA